METIARIRREHLVNGKTIKEIARDLKVSRSARLIDNRRSSNLEFSRAARIARKRSQGGAGSFAVKSKIASAMNSFN